MLSKNRLLLNQSFCTRDTQGNIHYNTRHTYESKQAIYDINIIDNSLCYAKNCQSITTINADDQKFFDFIKQSIS